MPLLRNVSSQRILSGLLISQVALFYMSNAPSFIIQACVKQNFECSWQSVAVEGRWWTLFTAHLHHNKFDHFLSNSLEICFGVVLLQKLLLPSGWVFLLLSSGAFSGLASLFWTYSQYAPAEASKVTAHLWPCEISSDWCNQVIKWNNVFNKFCELRCFELLSGTPGRLTREFWVDAFGEEAIGILGVDPECPFCGKSNSMKKRVVKELCHCGGCQAVMPLHSALLTCQACQMGLCGHCLEAKGLIHEVAEVVRLFEPYELWDEQSTRRSLGSSSIAQSITAVVGSWALHLAYLRYRCASLLVLPAFCVLQPLYDTAVLVRARYGNAEAAKQMNVSLSHLAGFSFGTLFYVMHLSWRSRSSLVCFPFAVR